MFVSPLIALAALAPDGARAQDGAVASPHAASLNSFGEVRGPTPYLSTSRFLRDLIAPAPAAPPPLRPPVEWRRLDPANYSPYRFFEHVRAAPLEVGAAAAALATVGVLDWHWGGAHFHTKREAYFSKRSPNGGMDKLGHAWSTYLLTELLAERMAANSNGLSGAHFSAAIVAFAVMAGVEVGDGFTKKYGFSREDLVADAVGAGLALLRGAFPVLRETTDFRVAYKMPGEYDPIRLATGRETNPAYSRQRYILAIKGSGFEALRKTPARYLELHFGYDTRGFHKVERDMGIKPRRNFYVGLGLNVSELLFAEGPVPNLSAYRDTELVWATEHALRYVQVPYTAVYARGR